MVFCQRFAVALLLIPVIVFGKTANTCTLKEAPCFHQCCPQGAAASNDVVNNVLYVVSSNRETKFADWVAYTVSADNLDGSGTKRNWKKDPSIPDGYTLKPADYHHASHNDYDRGHLAPLAHFSNHEAWEKTNYLSNVTPQIASLNRGLWLDLENTERKLVKYYRYPLVHVVTGTWYDKDAMPSLPACKLVHRVPNGYWKVIVVEDGNGKIGVAAFQMKQRELSQIFCDTRITLSALNKRAKLSILPDTPPGKIDRSMSSRLLADMDCT